MVDSDEQMERKIAFEDAMVDVYMYLPGAETLLTCPKCYRGLEFLDCIIHLNDFHKLSREEIADWVESLEEYMDLTFKEIERGG